MCLQVFDAAGQDGDGGSDAAAVAEPEQETLDCTIFGRISASACKISVPSEPIQEPRPKKVRRCNPTTRVKAHVWPQEQCKVPAAQLAGNQKGNHAATVEGDSCQTMHQEPAGNSELNQKMSQQDILQQFARDAGCTLGAYFVILLCGYPICEHEIRAYCRSTRG